MYITCTWQILLLHSTHNRNRKWTSIVNTLQLVYVAHAHVCEYFLTMVTRLLLGLFVLCDLFPCLIAGLRHCAYYWQFLTVIAISIICTLSSYHWWLPASQKNKRRPQIISQPRIVAAVTWAAKKIVAVASDWRNTVRMDQDRVPLRIVVTCYQATLVKKITFLLILILLVVLYTCNCNKLVLAVVILV